MYEWKEIHGGKYLLSNKGEIRHRSKSKPLKHSLDTNGYVRVSLSNGRGVNPTIVRIHRELAENFIPNPDNKPNVNHKDGDKTNFQLDNLEWSTAKENTNHAIDTGLFDAKRATEKATEASLMVNRKPLYVIDEKANITEYVSNAEASKALGISAVSIGRYRYDNVLVINSETGLPNGYGKCRPKD